MFVEPGLRRERCTPATMHLTDARATDNVTALVQLLIAVTKNSDISGMIRTALVRIIRYSNQ